MGNTQNKTKQNNKNFVAKGVINLDLNAAGASHQK